MFEKATRLKLRFESLVGLISVEDLWDLPLTSTRGKANLDDIARGLSRKIKDSQEESFVVKATAGNELLQLQFDIVKHVIDVRLSENEQAKQQKDAKDKKDQIMAIIARKKNEALEGASLEELQAMVASL